MSFFRRGEQISLLTVFHSSFSSNIAACFAGQQAALAYAKLNFGSYKHHFMPQIQRLMGCLLYHDKPLAELKYK
jgi:hypothetical protein